MATICARSSPASSASVSLLSSIVLFFFLCQSALSDCIAVDLVRCDRGAPRRCGVGLSPARGFGLFFCFSSPVYFFSLVLFSFCVVDDKVPEHIPPILDLVAAEDVDAIKYVDWRETPQPPADERLGLLCSADSLSSVCPLFCSLSSQN